MFKKRRGDLIKTNIKMVKRDYFCPICGLTKELKEDEKPPKRCPVCNSKLIQRIN